MDCELRFKCGERHRARDGGYKCNGKRSRESADATREPRAIESTAGRNPNGLLVPFRRYVAPAIWCNRSRRDVTTCLVTFTSSPRVTPTPFPRFSPSFFSKGFRLFHLRSSAPRTAPFFFHRNARPCPKEKFRRFDTFTATVLTGVCGFKNISEIL